MIIRKEEPTKLNNVKPRSDSWPFYRLGNDVQIQAGWPFPYTEKIQTKTKQDNRKPIKKTELPEEIIKNRRTRKKG